MDDLIIAGTKKIPCINFNIQAGIFNISGNSIMEDPYVFYHELNEYIEMYTNIFPKSTTINIHIEYMNTSSYRCLVNMLKNFLSLPSGLKVVVNWLYEADDELMLADGMECKRITDIDDFNFIPLVSTG